MEIRKVRSRAEVDDAAALVRELYEANKALYGDDLETIESYYRGSWFFDVVPIIPEDFKPPRGDVLVGYVADKPSGTVAISRMDHRHCELKSMFVAPGHRGSGLARALCEAVIALATEQGYAVVRLTTGVRQIAARNLYTRLGFKAVTPWEADPPDGYDYFELVIENPESRSVS